MLVEFTLDYRFDYLVGLVAQIRIVCRLFSEKILLLLDVFFINLVSGEKQGCEGGDRAQSSISDDLAG